MKVHNRSDPALAGCLTCLDSIIMFQEQNGSGNPFQPPLYSALSAPARDIGMADFLLLCPGIVLPAAGPAGDLP
jgi:hypothetical protein